MRRPGPRQEYARYEPRPSPRFSTRRNSAGVMSGRSSMAARRWARCTSSRLVAGIVRARSRKRLSSRPGTHSSPGRERQGMRHRLGAPDSAGRPEARLEQHRHHGAQAQRVGLRRGGVAENEIEIERPLDQPARIEEPRIVASCPCRRFPAQAQRRARASRAPAGRPRPVL